MRCHGLEFLRGQSRVEHKSLAFEQRPDLFQRGALGFLRFPPQPCLHKLQVLEDQIGFRVVGSQDGVRVQELVIADHIDLCVDILLRLDQLVGLVESRIFEIMFADFDFGNAEQRNFHSQISRAAANLMESARLGNAFRVFHRGARRRPRYWPV